METRIGRLRFELVDDGSLDTVIRSIDERGITREERYYEAVRDEYGAVDPAWFEEECQNIYDDSLWY